MIYLKDTINGAVRRFNDKVPKQNRKYKVFLKAKKYRYDDEAKTLIASPGRWEPSTKVAYDKWIEKTQGVQEVE